MCIVSIEYEHLDIQIYRHLAITLQHGALSPRICSGHSPPIASQQEQWNEAPIVTTSTGRFMSPPYLNEPRLHRIVGDVHV